MFSQKRYSNIKYLKISESQIQTIILRLSAELKTSIFGTTQQTTNCDKHSKIIFAKIFFIEYFERISHEKKKILFCDELDE